jgi:hypothetical protein
MFSLGYNGNCSLLLDLAEVALSVTLWRGRIRLPTASSKLRLRAIMLLPDAVAGEGLRDVGFIIKFSTSDSTALPDQYETSVLPAGTVIADLLAGWKLIEWTVNGNVADAGHIIQEIVLVTRSGVENSR